MTETTKTLKERITKVLQDTEESVSEAFFYEEGDEDFMCEQLPNVVYNLEDELGGEGQGDEYWKVYSFTEGKDKVYVQFYGYYSSYTGSEYEEWFFVEPREVMVTQYFKT